MSEGYLCDRCGSTHGGRPDTMLLVGDGRSRDRPALTRDKNVYDGRFHDIIGDVEFDLCQSCRNDLRRWWADGGGDPSKMERADTDGA